MPKEMLINVSEGEECRIALLEDGRLEELYMERTSATSHVGNIYKGRVTNVEASIQAAFIDFGLGRNGFLHISDLMPTYFGRRGEEIQESVGRKMSRRDRPPIQRCLRRGDEIIVQIIKEGIGTKGPTLSTYLSIPGKILVMMPGMGKMGVSKKIEDEQERRRLRQILDGLKPPKDVAFIIRTAGVGKTKIEIERDLKYLTRLWEVIVKKEQEPGPVELYTEGDLVTRTVRDLFSPDVERIVVDNKDVARRVKEVIKISSPRAKNRVDLYEDPVPLFHRANIESEIEMMYSRHVPLPSGGSLVIDSTEAVVAIDVNSGKNRDNNDAEMTAFKTDMEAADEIPRQLKLRDLGGVIICDFIDLRFERHRRELEERLFENFKNDRAKTKVLRMSQFGIIEITRQRMRPSLKRSIYFDCPHCKGAGLIKTPESISLDVMRKLSIALADLKVVRVELSVCPDVAFYLLNKKRGVLTELEARTKKKILIRTDSSLGLDELKFELFDSRDFAVVLEEIGMTVPNHPHTSQLGQRPAGHTHQGRGGRNNQRGRNDRKSSARPVPARAMEDDDDLDEDLEAIDNRDQDEMDRDTAPMQDREEDPTDIPAVLETEAGDEIAEEYADEEAGEGQGGEPDEDHENNHDENRDEMRPAARQQQRNPQNSQQQNRAPQGRHPNDRYQQDRQQQNRNQQNRGPQDRQPQDRQTQDRNQQGRGPQDRQPQDRQPQDRQPQDRQPQDRNQQGRAPQDRPPQDRHPQDRNQQGRPPQNREQQPNQNLASGEFNNDQGGMAGEGGGRRRRRRRGRRGRGRGGQQQPNDQNFQEGFEPNGNINPDAKQPSDEYPEDHEAGELPFDEGQPTNESAPVTEPGDQPASAPSENNADGEQRPRRRRRRGGRRHRRRNADGSVIENDAPTGDGPENSSDDRDEFEPETENVPAAVEELPRKRPVVEAPQVEVEPEPIAEEPVIPEPVEEPAPVVKPKAKRASRAKTTKVTPKRTPPKKSAKSAAASPPTPEVAQPSDVVRTGSADKHLVSDDPVLPPSLSRPRSYSDLDAIPDDYD